MTLWSLLLKSGIVFFAVLGVLLNVLDSGQQILARLSYFTNQSNLAVATFYGIWIIRRLRGYSWEQLPFFLPLRMALLVSILLTGIVYHLLLAPDAAATPGFTAHDLANLLVHGVVPCATLLDFLLYDQKGLFRWHHALYGCLFPLLYLLYVSFYVRLGGHFIGRLGSISAPYFFLDIAAIGLEGVMSWCLLLLICLLIGSVALVALDHQLFALSQHIRQ